MIKFGLDSKKALQMAFAIANTQKSKGIAPSNPGWIEELNLDRVVNEYLHNTVFAAIELDANTVLNRVI